MRGVAALTVMLFHAHPLFGVQMVPGGYLAVDMFFVLSGCVIAHAYGDRLARGMPVGVFVASRLIRFYPFYLAGLMFGVCLALMLKSVGSVWSMTDIGLVLAILCGLLFVPLPPIRGGGDIFPLNIPSWSLFYELLVNVLYARTSHRLSTRVLVAVTFCTLAITAVAIWRHGSGMAGPSLRDAPSALARTIFSFCAGLLIVRHRRSYRIHPLIVIAAVLFALVIPIADQWRWLFDLVCVALVFPTATWLLIGSSAPSCERVFSYLGTLSYGLYATHYPLIWLTVGFTKKTGISPVFTGSVLVALLPPTCAFVEQHLESPLRALLNRQLLGRPPSHAGRVRNTMLEAPLDPSFRPGSNSSNF